MAGLRVARRVGHPSKQIYRHRSSVVEHTLGKGEVEGSSPFGGSGAHAPSVPRGVSDGEMRSGRAIGLATPMKGASNFFTSARSS